jgi:hypothetical protein
MTFWDDDGPLFQSTVTSQFLRKLDQIFLWASRFWVDWYFKDLLPDLSDLWWLVGQRSSARGGYFLHLRVTNTNWLNFDKNWARLIKIWGVLIHFSGGDHELFEMMTTNFFEGKMTFQLFKRRHMSPVFRQVLQSDLIFLDSRLFSTSSQ